MLLINIHEARSFCSVLGALGLRVRANAAGELPARVLRVLLLDGSGEVSGFSLEDAMGKYYTL